MRSIKRTTVIALMTAMLTGINILGDYSTNIMAGEANYKIKNLETLKKQISIVKKDGKITTEEKETIEKTTKPEVLCEYFEETMDQLKDTINKTDVEKVMNHYDGTRQYGNTNIELEDGNKVYIEFEDKEEQNILGNMGNILVQNVQAATSGEKVWKSYGNRYFTAKAEIISGIGGAKVALENHYKLSSNGIDERYGDAYPVGSFSVGITGNISVGTVAITDSVARTPGKSDVNMYARFIWSINVSSMTSQGNSKLSTTIKYLKKDAANKKIQVQHKWSMSKNWEKI